MRVLALAALCVATVIAGTACSEDTPKLVEKSAIKKVSNRLLAFNPRVDILFVIDDSGSMSGHQLNLSHNIQLFTDAIFRSQVIDYHIGVITSSADGFPGANTHGRLVGTPPYVERSTANGAKALARNLIVGTNGSATEMFFEPVKLALSLPTSESENAGFLRPDAHLVTIFITDTDDQSRGISEQEFYDFLVQLKGGGERVLSFAAYIPSHVSDCDRSGEEIPSRLEKFFSMANSKIFSLCDADYGQQLAGLSEEVVASVARNMPLGVPPDVGTIEVWYGTQQIPNDPVTGWAYDPLNNALIFGKGIEFTNQAPGTEIEVSFRAAEY